MEDGLMTSLSAYAARVAQLALLASALGWSSAHAATVVDEWKKIKVPSAPKLGEVTVDPSTTALLLLDFNGAQNPDKGPCNTKVKPRCIAELPHVAKLMKEARDSGAPVVYSITSNAAPEDIATVLAPKDGDPIVKSGANKFINTDLEKILTDRHIKTVIVTGTASEGAVLNTAAYAALKGMDVVLPVDGMSSTDPYAEQYVTWHFANAPGVSAKTKLTKIDAISFGKAPG
jgi:nicotinamidase-related amidase